MMEMLQSGCQTVAVAMGLLMFMMPPLPALLRMLIPEWKTQLKSKDGTQTVPDLVVDCCDDVEKTGAIDIATPAPNFLSAQRNLSYGILELPSIQAAP
jgi:hypothetical protein